MLRDAKPGAIYLHIIAALLGKRALLACVGVFLLAAALPARANIFTVSGIEISATANNAAEAKQIAIAEGQSKALAQIFQKITRPEDATSLPAVNQETLQQVVAGFSLDNERTGPTQYLASLTVRFQPDAIELLLAQNGIKLAVVQSEPTLMIPVYWSNNEVSLFDGSNPWTETFRRMGLENRFVPLIMPLGDSFDASMDREAVLAGEPNALGQLMGRYGVEYSVIATAVYEPDKAVMGGTVTGDAPFGPVNVQQQVDVVPGEEQRALRELANLMLDSLDQAWRGSAEGSAGPSSEDFAFVVPFRDLQEWNGVRNRLETMSGVKSVNVEALAAGSASVIVSYAGDLNGFLTDLDQLGYAMYDTGQRWELGLR